MAGHDLSGVATKGYVVMRSFLDESELRALRADYDRLPVQDNSNYKVKQFGAQIAAPYMAKISATLLSVREQAGIDADMFTTGFFFATRDAVFPWHVDHEDWFLTQEHYHCLNFYIPLIKSDPVKSGLCVVPFDDLATRSRELARKLTGAGAMVLEPRGNRTLLRDNNVDATALYDVKIDELAKVPPLREGDLLLMRGDIVHRTQDAVTERVSVSFRAARSTSRVYRDRFVSGGPTKLEVMLANPKEYGRVLSCFARTGRTELSLREATTAAFGPSNELAAVEASYRDVIQGAFRLRRAPPGA